MVLPWTAFPVALPGGNRRDRQFVGRSARRRHRRFRVARGYRNGERAPCAAFGSREYHIATEQPRKLPGDRKPQPCAACAAGGGIRLPEGREDVLFVSRRYAAAGVGHLEPYLRNPRLTG